MIIEACILGSVAFKIGCDYTKDIRKEHKIKKEIRKVFSDVLDGIGTQAENKIKIDYKIEEIYIKNYGFDAIIMIPWGLSLLEFRKLVPTLESAYNAEIIIDYSANKNTMYLRCHIQSIKDINPKDVVRFKLIKSFSKFNSSGETFKIKKINDITNPATKDNIGYSIRIEIPNQLEYGELKDYEGVLNNAFPRAFISKDKKGDSIVDIILKPLGNKEEYKMIKCNPWELYVGMTYGYKPVLLDYKSSPNAIIGGQSGSGKTVGMLSGVINLALQHNSNDFQMLIGSIADKQDLRILTKLPHCKYYAKDLANCLKLMRYLHKENSRRNKMFDKCKKYTTNIFEYNKNNPKSKLPILYFVTDEIADFMEEPQDSKATKRDKKEFQSLFWKLARQGRSSGCWIVCATQRADRDNLGANVKAQMGNKVCFYQPNLTSAQTVMGDGDGVARSVTQLIKANREFLCECSDGLLTGKSLFLTNDMMENLLKPKFIKPNYLKLDANGDVIIKEEVKDEENSEKVDENTKNTGKNNEKAPNSTINLDKLRGKLIK